MVRKVNPCTGHPSPLDIDAMPKGYALDVPEIHEKLWEKADRLGRLRILQKDFAEEVGVTHFAITRLFKRMEEEGRMKKMASHKGNTWTYAIRDPASFG